MKNKYVDMTSIIQVIGNIYRNPKLLEATDKYFFNEEDFVDDFHKIVFGTAFNLFQLGAKELTLAAVEDYLTQREKKYAIYKAHKGNEYITTCVDKAKPAAFDYYYNRMKKMTLLRAYDKKGIDVSWIYDDDNILDLKKKQLQEDQLDNMTLMDIVIKIDNYLTDIKLKYVDDAKEGCSIGDGIDDLLDSLAENPEIGYPLFGSYMSTVTRGARLGKFYLRSAATGVGKSRSMIADACYIGCSHMYDLTSGKWVTIGSAQPTLYIATEQDLSEVQTMCLAFLSGVDEDHILTNTYFSGEIERVRKAAQILKQSKLRFETLPDFSLQDIENSIKRNIRDFGVLYIFLDYMHTSMKILEEITKRSGGVRLREDNILFMMSIRLKDICIQNNVFIMSATQLNADYQTSETPDQNLLRGAKSIADKIDWGAIMLEVTADDLEKLQPVLGPKGFDQPVIKISIYKNRRGRWKGIYLWCKANRGICRIEPMFVTKYNYEMISDIEDLKIKVEDESAF